jgi:hypothetical protein
MKPHMRIGVAESGGVHRASTAARFTAKEDEAKEKNAPRSKTGIRRLFTVCVLFIMLPFLH